MFGWQIVGVWQPAEVERDRAKNQHRKARGRGSEFSRFGVWADLDMPVNSFQAQCRQEVSASAASRPREVRPGCCVRRVRLPENAPGAAWRGAAISDVPVR